MVGTCQRKQDGFDVVVEYEGWQRRIQLKTVLSSRRASRRWERKNYFLRPPLAAGNQLINIEPDSRGRAGGCFVLIESDDPGEIGSVRYAFSDF
jgi:hypothetical protein